MDGSIAMGTRKSNRRFHTFCRKGVFLIRYQWRGIFSVTDAIAIAVPKCGIGLIYVTLTIAIPIFNTV